MLLEVKNLKTKFRSERGDTTVVDGVSFELDSARSLGIVGESGCGKSVTLFSILNLFFSGQAHLEGETFFKGEQFSSLPREVQRSRMGKEIGIIFQDPLTSLNPVMRVGDQVAEGYQYHFPTESKAAIRERVIRCFESVGLPDPIRTYSTYPHELSGGMRQRVLTAMALICQPSLLFADEPTTALDVSTERQLLNFIHKEKEERQMGVVLISHDFGVVGEWTDEILVMYLGVIIERGPTSKVLASPLHPYTKALLDSRPILENFEKKHHRLKSIDGSVPSFQDRPSGCRFSNRCPIVKPTCKTIEPRLEVKQSGHWVRCYEIPCS